MKYKDKKELGNNVLSPEKADVLVGKIVEDKKSKKGKTRVVKEWKNQPSSEKTKIKDNIAMAEKMKKKKKANT